MSLFQEIGYICTNPRTIAGETKDCTVRALCHAADISYEEAHAALKAHGRKDRKGCYPSHFIPAYEKFGFKRLPVKYNSMTAGAFMEANPTGSFILTIAGHAFAYVNGRQIDNVNVLFARRKLLMAFARVEEVKPLPEIKTTDDASQAGMLKAIRAYRYNLQAYWYRLVFELATGRRPVDLLVAPGQHDVIAELESRQRSAD